jgi:penicillin-binding protein
MFVRRISSFYLIILFTFLSGCQESIQTPEEVFQQFASAWEQDEFEAMYEFLSSSSKMEITLEEFVNFYSSTYSEIGASNLSIDLILPEVDEREESKQSEVTIPYEKSLTMFTGDMKLDSTVTMLFDEAENAWRVEWTPELIFPMMEQGDRVKLRTLFPTERGEIFDRNGVGMAINGKVYEIGAVPERMIDEAEEIRQLSEKIGVTEEFIHAQLNQGWVRPDTFVPLKKVPFDQEEFVKELYETIPVATYKEVPARVYPAGKAAAHLTGYLGLIREDELEEDTERVYHSNSTVGRAGLESLFEHQLRGQSGGEVYIEDDEGEVKYVLQKKEAVNGEALHLTIDLTLQQAVFQKFVEGNDTGTGVAIHPITGEVLTLVNSPVYDPNEFTLGISTTRYEQLENDPQKPLLNRFSRAFIPGSTIKPITAAIALKHGLDPDKKMASSNSGWQKDPSWGNHLVRRVSNPLDQLNLNEAMMYSDNIYFAKLAVDLGVDKLEQGLADFGFGERMPFMYRFTESKIAADGIDNEVLLADTGYGQGELLVNPLHLAMLYTAFVNNGSIPKPLLLTSEESETWLENVVSGEHSNIVLQSMIEVIHNPEGTASHVQLDQTTLAGKTGTAEHKSSREGEETGEETGWFIALDTEDPELLILLMMEHVENGRGSGYVATKVKELYQDLLSE